MAMHLTQNINWLKNNKIRGVVQAGMGGGEAAEIAVWNIAGIKNQIYIEPYPSYYDMCIKSVKYFSGENVKSRCLQGALTNIVGKTKLFLNNIGSSHSTLLMYGNRPDVLKHMVSTGEIEVDAFTLDSIFESPDLNPENYNLLFLDTQSSEHLIIEGAKNTLKYFDFIQIEISTKQVYADSLIYDEWVPMMDKLGYEVIATETFYYGDGDLAKDVTFSKKSLQYLEKNTLYEHTTKIKNI